MTLFQYSGISKAYRILRITWKELLELSNRDTTTEVAFRLTSRYDYVLYYRSTSKPGHKEKTLVYIHAVGKIDIFHNIQSSDRYSIRVMFVTRSY